MEKKEEGGEDAFSCPENNRRGEREEVSFFGWGRRRRPRPRRVTQKKIVLRRDNEAKALGHTWERV